MKKMYSLQLYIWLFLTILFSQCTKVDLEEGVRKTTILRHNYIAITTKDDIPGEVEVHYIYWAIMVKTKSRQRGFLPLA